MEVEKVSVSYEPEEVSKVAEANPSHVGIGLPSELPLDQEVDIGRPKGPSMRQMRLSSEWGSMTEDEVHPFFLTTFMVDHPFLVHFVVLALSATMVLVNMDPLLNSISISAILPDYGHWTDGFHADEIIKRKLKIIRSTGAPQSIEDGAHIQFFTLVGCDLVEDPDCDMKTRPWILTPTNLAKIIEYEAHISGHPKWLDTCHVPLEELEFPECSAPFTISTVLASMLGSNQSAWTTLAIKGLVQMFLTAQPAMAALFDPSIMDGLSGDASEMTATKYMSMHSFALPYPTTIRTLVDANGTIYEQNKSSTYANYKDRRNEQRQEHAWTGKDWLWELYRKYDYEPGGDYRDGTLGVNSLMQTLWGDFYQWHVLRTTIPLYIVAR